MRQLIWVALFLGLLTPVLAVEERVIAYGNDLTLEEKTAVSRDFPLPAGVKLNAVKSITVTNEEEWQLLKGLLPDSEIGTKAISSVYIEKLTLGAGRRCHRKEYHPDYPAYVRQCLGNGGD